MPLLRKVIVMQGEVDGQSIQAGVTGVAESQGAAVADGPANAGPGENSLPGRSREAEAAEIVAALENDANMIVKAWDQLYAPEGIGVGIIVPVEVATMRRAAAFISALPIPASEGEIEARARILERALIVEYLRQCAIAHRQIDDEMPNLYSTDAMLRYEALAHHIEDGKHLSVVLAALRNKGGEG